jgi:uncharacterized protein (DUF2267 family)
MPYSDWVSDVRTRAGLRTGGEAKRALEATVTVLGRSIRDVDAREIADPLPRELARILDALEFTGELPLASFHQRVGQRLGLEPAVAKPQVEAVCAVLAGRLPRSMRYRMPAPLAVLFQDPDAVPALTGYGARAWAHARTLLDDDDA